MKNQIKGGKADKMSCEDIAKKHSVFVGTIKKQLEMGIKVEREHTNNDAKAKEIAMDHLAEFPDYYTRLHKMEKQGEKALEAKESMGADASGSYEGALSGPILKKDIHKLHNWKAKQKEVKEITGSDVSAGAMYDAPIGHKSKDPLKIDNPRTASITAASSKDMKSTKKGFPRFGGPDAKFVEIDKKCKKYPYCNQGAGSDKSFSNSGVIKLKEMYELKDAIIEASKKYGISPDIITRMVIKEAYGLPGDIDLSPIRTWGKGNKNIEYVYTLTTNEPINITINDEIEFEKIKSIFYKNNIKFNENKRPRTEDDNQIILTEPNYDEDDDTIWPEDDDIFDNTK